MIYFSYELEKIGQELSVALASDNFAPDKKDTLLEIFTELDNESQISTAHPLLASLSYPLTIETLDQSFGQGVHLAIRAILDGEERQNEKYAKEIEDNKIVFRQQPPFEICLSRLLKHPGISTELGGIICAFLQRNNGSEPTDIFEIESPQYIKQALKNHFGEDLEDSEEDDLEDEASESTDDANAEPLKVLDLSAHPENLNILAGHLSAVLKDPDTPTEIHDCILDRLDRIPFDQESPEWIAGNLKILQQEKGNG